MFYQCLLNQNQLFQCDFSAYRDVENIICSSILIILMWKNIICSNES